MDTNYHLDLDTNLGNMTERSNGVVNRVVKLKIFYHFLLQSLDVIMFELARVPSV
jgi:hypothetical protein